YALVQWIELSATSAAVVWAVLAGGLVWGLGLWRPRLDVRELPGILLCAAVTLLWCRHSAEAPAILLRTDVLPVWIDYVIHGGVGAVAVLTLVPEAGDYGLRYAFFGFDWHVITHPSAAYATGIALVSFAFLKRWCDERRPRLLALSAALAAGLLLFRAHVFLL